MPNDLLSTRQVAKELGVHQKTVEKYCRDGLLKANKLGGNGKSNRPYKIRRADLDAFISGKAS